MKRVHVGRWNLVLWGALALALVVIASRVVRPPSLTVYLHCDSGVDGILSLVSVSPDGHEGSVERFDVKRFCAESKIELSQYKAGGQLRFALERDEGERPRGVAEPGRDIHSDKNGAYTVIKITAGPPYIQNDEI